MIGPSVGDAAAGAVVVPVAEGVGESGDTVGFEGRADWVVVVVLVGSVVTKVVGLCTVVGFVVTKGVVVVVLVGFVVTKGIVVVVLVGFVVTKVVGLCTVVVWVSLG